MALTRESLKTRLLLRLGGRTDVDDLINTWGDEGLINLCSRRLEIRSLQAVGTPITTSPGSATIAIPSNAFAVRFLEDVTNDRVYRRFDGGMFEFLQAKQSAGQEVPAQFIEDGNLIYMLPIPNGVFTINPYIYTRATWGTDPASQPSIEQEWHHGVLLLSAMVAFEDLGDEERTAAAKAEFEMWLAERDTPVRRTQRTNIMQRGPQTEVGRRNKFGVR